MAFNWVIVQLDSVPSVDGLDKVISTIHFRAQKESDGFIADYFGALGVSSPDKTNFTPYEKVTKEMVEGWLNELTDSEAIEAELNNKIDAFFNPPIEIYPLPWSDL